MSVSMSDPQIFFTKCIASGTAVAKTISVVGQLRSAGGRRGMYPVILQGVWRRVHCSHLHTPVSEGGRGENAYACPPKALSPVSF